MASFPMARFGQNRYSHIDSDTDHSYDAHRGSAHDIQGHPLTSFYDAPPKAGIHDTDKPKLQASEQTLDSSGAARRRKALRPRPLPPPSARWSELAPEITNLLFTIAFVGLGIAVIKLKGQPESGWSGKVVSATKIAPSLFPILFSAVLGNLLKVFAHWKVERGAELGALEQLMGSQTVASAIKSVYVLRAFGVYTMLLIPLWAFNPLGSQASFRSVYLRDEFSTGTRVHSYQNNTFDYEVEQSALGSGSGWMSSQPMVRSLYGAALFDPDAGAQYANGTSDGFDGALTRLGGKVLATGKMTTDLWNNVRIPEIRTLPGYDAKNADDWIRVPRNSEVVNYTSIIGLPARGNPTLFPGNISFAVNSSYHDFECSAWKNFTLDEFFGTWMPDNYKKLTNLYNKTLDQNPYLNAVSAMLPFTSGFFMDTINGSTSASSPPSIALVSRGMNNYYTTSCQTSLRYVEVNVTCLQDSSSISSSHAQCAAARIRSLTNLPSRLNPNFTAFNMVPHGYNIAHDFPTILAKTQHSMTSTQTELFIVDPPNAFLGAAAKIAPVELGAVPIKTFERRFGLLFNTFWKASVAPSLIVGGSVNATLFFDADSTFVNTTGHWTQRESPLYTLNIPWLTVFFVANVVMFAAALGAVLLKLQCVTPDLLGYVSSVTRDSQFFAMQGGGSALDGAERARLLKRDRVKLVDVGLGGDVGRIALVPEGTALPWKDVIPGRIYE